MTSNKIDGKAIRFAEFMRYLGLWLIMSTQVKTNVYKYFFIKDWPIYQWDSLQGI